MGALGWLEKERLCIEGNGEPGKVAAAGDKGQRIGVCLQVGDLPPSVIPVHMVVVGCPISSLRTNYTADPLQKEPVLRCPRRRLLRPLETLWPPAWLLSSCFSTGPGPLGATQQESPGQGCPGGARPQGTWLLPAQLRRLVGSND